MSSNPAQAIQHYVIKFVSLSVSYSRWVVFSGYSGFFHQSGIKQHKPTYLICCLVHTVWVLHYSVKGLQRISSYLPKCFFRKISTTSCCKVFCHLCTLYITRNGNDNQLLVQCWLLFHYLYVFRWPCILSNI